MNATKTGTTDAGRTGTLNPDALQPPAAALRALSDLPGSMTQTAAPGSGRTASSPLAASPATIASPGKRPSETPADAVTADPVGRAWPVRRVPQFRTAAAVIAGAVAFAVALYGGYRWWRHARAWVNTDNAYVAAHIHTISARVSGTVKEVLAEENQWVTAGTILARLDPRDFEVKQKQALAQVAQAKAQRQQAVAQIAQAEAQVAREQARATKAQRDLTRAKSLSQGTSGAISRQEFDQAEAEAEAAQAALQGAQSALAAANALTGVAQAQEQVALAGLQEAELQLSYTDIVAPTDGRIGKRNLESGNRVQPGQALLALVQPDVWVTANFKETQSARMQAGQTVRVALDAFPGRSFVGRVEGVSPASGAQFALLPPDNATGNFTKIVQRVPVKVVFDLGSLGDCQGRVVAGMSAVVEVKVRE